MLSVRSLTSFALFTINLMIFIYYSKIKILASPIHRCNYLAATYFELFLRIDVNDKNSRWLRYDL